jgi:hypothetical protein
VVSGSAQIGQRGSCQCVLCCRFVFFGSGDCPNALLALPGSKISAKRTAKHHQEPQSPYRCTLERGGDSTLKTGRALARIRPRECKQPIDRPLRLRDGSLLKKRDPPLRSGLLSNVPAGRGPLRMLLSLMLARTDRYRETRICSTTRIRAVATERLDPRSALFQSPLLNGLSFSTSFCRGEGGADETAAGEGEVSGFAIGSRLGIDAYPSNRGTRSGSLLFGVPFGNLKSNTLTPNRLSPL